MNVASSVPAVIDWLVENIGTLPECARPVRVFDGYPDTEAPTMVIVGSAIRPVVDSNSQIETITGGQQESEEYVVSVDIHASTGATSQKAVRDKVYAIRDAIHGLIRANNDAGQTSALGIDGVLWARVVTGDLTQTGEEDAAEGRIAVLSMGVHVYAWLG